MHNHRHQHAHRAFHAANTVLDPQLFHGQNVVPREPAKVIEIPSVVRRSGPKAGFSTQTPNCPPGDNSALCQRPVSSSDTTALPIALGVVIPLVAAMILFIFLHRRHVRRQRIEDANDKHASLDFGLPASRPITRKKVAGGPQMTDASNAQSIRRGHGVSIDLGSPYVIAEGRPSYHSLTRSAIDSDDPYRPSTLVKTETSSLHSGRADSKLDTYSVLSRSSRSNSASMQARLVHNAEKPSASTPPTANSPVFEPHKQPQFLTAPEPAHTVSRRPVLPPKPELPPPPTDYIPATLPELPSDQNSPPEPVPRKSVPKGPNFSIPRNVERQSLHANSLDTPEQDSQAPAPALPELDWISHEQPFMASQFPEEKIFINEPPAQSAGPVIFEKNAPLPDLPMEAGYLEADDYHLNASPAELYDDRRFSSIRPLPPHDPLDNPEQRANRIRSFYREYFDETKPEPVGRPDTQEYYEDYGQEYLNEASYYDPASGEFVFYNAPYAEPVTRRAMTPPPRAPPRFQSRQRNMSNGFVPQGPRGYRAYSASGHSPMMGARGRAPRRPQLPPPAALTTLPTPHRLREDSAIFNPLDFAPPPTYRDRQAGRPSSPLGEKRPYSPSVRAHTPLQSSFDDLAAMPSPHALRKSGTFTALDFAPPPRFARGDTGSDAGSVRSAGSSMSAAHMYNIRNGAYRVSRIPKDFIGTKEDFAKALKPSWTLQT